MFLSVNLEQNKHLVSHMDYKTFKKGFYCPSHTEIEEVYATVLQLSMKNMI